MHDNAPKVSLWLEDAIAVAAFAVLLYLAPFVLSLERGDEKPAEVAKPARTGTELCIAQYAAGQRWIRHQAVYECAAPARELPSYILSMPVWR